MVESDSPWLSLSLRLSELRPPLDSESEAAAEGPAAGSVPSECRGAAGPGAGDAGASGRESDGQSPFHARFAITGVTHRDLHWH